jgi:hypothetical protein
MTLSLFSYKEKIMEKEKVGKSKEEIYLTNLDDLCQIITELRGQISYIIEKMRDAQQNNDAKILAQQKEYDEILAEQLGVCEKHWWHICDVHKITRQLISDINKKDSVLMVPVHSGQCCYIGNGGGHHVIQITELLCNKIRKGLEANTFGQENYIYTKLATLHRTMTNYDNELCRTLEDEYSKDNWKEKQHEIDGWVEIQGRCNEVKRIADNLISETNKSDSVLLIEADSGESYYLGCGTELHVIHVSKCTYKVIQELVSEMDKETEKPKPSVTANELMYYVEEQMKKYNFRPDDLDKIINGLWAEKVSCTVRNCLMFDGIQGARIMHYEIVDAFNQILVIMKENNLVLEDLDIILSPPELPCPEVMFSISTKGHLYEYYPIMLSSHYGSEEDEYIETKNGIVRLQTSYRESNCQSEDDFHKA